MNDEIKSIMSRVFGVPVEQITDDASPDSIAKWDSLNHMNLMIALEEAFKIKFDADEIISMMNYKLICMTLKEKNVF